MLYLLEKNKEMMEREAIWADFADYLKVQGKEWEWKYVRVLLKYIEEEKENLNRDEDEITRIVDLNSVEEYISSVLEKYGLRDEMEKRGLVN